LRADFKAIADLRRDNGKAIRKVCVQLLTLCRSIGLFEKALVVIDGRKFKAVSNRDKNFTAHMLKARQQQLGNRPVVVAFQFVRLAGSSPLLPAPISLGIEQNGVPLMLEAANAGGRTRQATYFDWWSCIGCAYKRIGGVEYQEDSRIYSCEAPTVPLDVLKLLVCGDWLRQYAGFVGFGQKEPPEMIAGPGVVGQYENRHQ
jgi:hypothetical protein